MSFFTDFLIADRSEAEAIAKTDNPIDHWPGTTIKSIGDLDLANLYAILLGDGDAVELMDEFELLYIEDIDWGDDLENVDIDDIDFEDGQVHQLPTRMVHLLSEMKDDDFFLLAEQWADSDEFRDYYQAEDLMELLKELQKLALQAISESKCLMFHSCG